jgi:two-component system sensor histidine kinase ChiS
LIIPFSSAEAYNIIPQAVKGVLDLSHWSFADDGPVKIKGDFEFYWEKLLAPGELKKAGPFDRTGYIKVPGVWDGYSVDGRRLTGMGYATYRLIINWDKNKISSGDI